MAAKKKAAKKKTAKRSVFHRAARPAAAPAKVLAWLDDPMSKLGTAERPVPDLARGPLKYKIRGAAVPAKIYPLGTPQFRYWAAAEALRRGGDFWAPILGVKHWQPGAVLPVNLDKGVDLNAYYNRTELAFFHKAVGNVVYYSGESPDVVCHEMGHACLDAHRPELWDAPFIEAGAFHESFGDMSAILSALQLVEVRKAALAGVKGDKASPLSRCAEQLGHALGLIDKSLVDPDCLRNAWNSFKWVDPQTLPDDAPASELSAEVHSFSRVFTGAFYEALSGMLNIRSRSPTEADLAAVASDFAQLLVDATAAAPVQPNYFAQVASHIIDADTTRFKGKYRSALASTFVKRLIVPRAAVEALHAAGGKTATSIARTAITAQPETQSHKVALDAKEFGLAAKELVVVAPIERKPFFTMAAGLTHTLGLAEVHQAAHRFVKMLFARDRVDTESHEKRVAITPQTTHAQLRKTHVLTKTKDGLKLQRRLFHCGCRVPCDH